MGSLRALKCLAIISSIRSPLMGRYHAKPCFCFNRVMGVGGCCLFDLTELASCLSLTWRSNSSIRLSRSLKISSSYSSSSSFYLRRICSYSALFSSRLTSCLSALYRAFSTSKSSCKSCTSSAFCCISRLYRSISYLNLTISASFFSTMSSLLISYRALDCN